MSLLINTVAELQEVLATKESIGFVPTMGNLHTGHLTLLEECCLQNVTNVISIFVNPTQFGPGEDFNNYPRTLGEDLEKIEQLEMRLKKEIIVFAPKGEAEIYPDGKQLEAEFGPIDMLEGALRPGHFAGMITVVKRLFEIVGPQRAYFGKKDYQQLCIVKELVKRFQMNIEIIGLPIVREINGLAMSSRNVYLTHEQKSEALTLFQSLNQLKKSYQTAKSLKIVTDEIETIKKDGRFNYLELREQDTLMPVKSLDQKVVLLGNFQLGKTKLLDNLEC